MTSAILDAYRINTKTRMMLKCFGWTCIPCCCVGASCIVAAEEYTPATTYLKNTIDTYGGNKNCKEIGAKVREELAKFRKAVTAVNTYVSPQIINPNMTLFDVICKMEPKINAICTSSNSLDFYRFFKNDNDTATAYATAIWLEYTNIQGGNYHVIAYGLMEYQCMFYEATSMIGKVSYHLLDKFSTDTALRVECLSHKEAAGF